MLSSSTLLFAVLCSISKAGHLVDITSNVRAKLIEPSNNSSCSYGDVFTLLPTTQTHDGACLHEVPFTYSGPIAEPWTIQPACSANNTEDEFCLFTSSSFSHNRGISILTKPSIANAISRLQVFSSSRTNSASSSTNNFRPPPFEVVSLPGRGLGLIANRTIQRGDLIKVHTATLVFHDDVVDKQSPDFVSTEHLMKAAVNQLPEYSRELFMSMAAHNESEEPYIERIHTNTFGEDFGGDGHSIIIPETARMNHDCRPNAVYYFDHKTLSHYTHAARTIYAGEEITVTYIDPVQTRRKRLSALKHSWGFDCSCSQCSQSRVMARESNRRILQIQRIHEAFEEDDDVDSVFTNPKEVKGTPGMAELLISLYEQERLDGTMAFPYQLAALRYSAVGNEWLAVKWAMKSVEAGIISDGARDAGVRDMKQLLDEPRKHWSWGVNRKRKGTKETQVEGKVSGG